MSTSKNTTKWLLWILVGVLILTYLISINMENNFVSANSRWLSNNFLFAVASGAFASLVIVLTCELIRYRQLKTMAENTLFAYFANLYGQFLIIRSNCLRAIQSHDVVADNLIQSYSDYAIMLTDQINAIDYEPFRNNKVKDIFTQFKVEKYLATKNILTNFLFFRVAFHEDKKNMIIQGKYNAVTSDCPNVNNVLNKIIGQTTTILTYLDQIIAQIDNEFGNRYHWQDVKKTLNDYQTHYIGQELKDYLKEDVIVF